MKTDFLLYIRSLATYVIAWTVVTLGGKGVANKDNETGPALMHPATDCNAELKRLIAY